MLIARAAGAFILAVLLAAPAWAQMNAGELSGVVRDESGGVLPGATVTATHVDSGLAFERVSDAEGRFFISSLPIGEWEVAVSLPGFRRAVRTGIVLDIGRTFELRYTLQLGQLAAGDDALHHGRFGRQQRVSVPRLEAGTSAVFV